MIIDEHWGLIGLELCWGSEDVSANSDDSWIEVGPLFKPFLEDGDVANIEAGHNI